VPARVITIDSLPEIGIGKVDRRALRRLAEKA
jgi:non-ribosomal peptide synthetase component E (peptide arylation enzyme)